MKALIAGLLLAATAAIMTTSLTGTPSAQATDHAEVFEDVPVYLTHYTQTNNHRGTAEQGVRTANVARNLITGDSQIKICVEIAAYRDAAEEAAEVLNDGLNPGRDVFVVVGVDEPCDSDAMTIPRLQGIQSVVITEDNGATGRRACDSQSLACTEPTHVSSDPYYSYRGQSYIGVEDARLSSKSHDVKVATLAHELGHVIGLSHPWEFGTFSRDGVPIGPGDACAGDLWASNPGGKDLLTITDSDRYDAVNANAGVILGALMSPLAICQGDAVSPSNSAERTWSSSGVALQPYDKMVYKAAYTPQAVTDMAAGFAPDLSGRVKLTWEGDHVNLENHFEVQVLVRNRTTGNQEWKRVTIQAANQETVAFTQPTNTAEYTVVTRVATQTTKGSRATYRVVSTTEAFGDADPEGTSLSASAEHETPVVVITYQFVCVEWGFFLSWRNTILNEVRHVRPTGFSSAATAQFTLDASVQLIGSGGGVAPPFPILAQYVFCSATTLVAVPSGSAQAGARGGGDTPIAQAEVPGDATAESSTPTQVDAALATLTTCMSSVASPADKSACVTAFANAVDAIAAGEGGPD